MRTVYRTESHLTSHLSVIKRHEHESPQRRELEAERDARLVLELEDALRALSEADEHYERELQEQHAAFAAAAAHQPEVKRGLTHGSETQLEKEKGQKRFGFGKRPWRNAKPYLHFGWIVNECPGYCPTSWYEIWNELNLYVHHTANALESSSHTSIHTHYS